MSCVCVEHVCVWSSAASRARAARGSSANRLEPHPLCLIPLPPRPPAPPPQPPLPHRHPLCAPRSPSAWPPRRSPAPWRLRGRSHTQTHRGEPTPLRCQCTPPGLPAKTCISALLDPAAALPAAAMVSLMRSPMGLVSVVPVVAVVPVVPVVVMAGFSADMMRLLVGGGEGLRGGGGGAAFELECHPGVCGLRDRRAPAHRRGRRATCTARASSLSRQQLIGGRPRSSTWCSPHAAIREKRRHTC